VGVVALVAAIVAVVAALTALGQIRTERAERGTVEHRIRAIARGEDPQDDRPPTGGRGRVSLEIEVAQLTVVPAPAGQALRLESRYDPERYELDERFEETDAPSWTYLIRFAPRGSSMMALLRMKLGGELPKLRLTLPRDVRLVLDGGLRGGIGALELGSLSVESTELRVDGGAVNLSFAEPLAEPMESLTLIGDKGSIEVTGLGNASPRSTRIQQHLGEIDLDLRGGWTRDADLRIGAYFAGGSVWLPEGVTIQGLEDRFETATEPSELPRPVLHFKLERHGGRLVVVE
jgi:hypothetical protein